MLIYTKHRYTILGKLTANPDIPSYKFDVPLDDGRSVTVTIIHQEAIAESFCSFDISDGLWQYLQKGLTDCNRLYPKLQNDLGNINSTVSAATRKVLYLIKYRNGLHGSIAAKGLKINHFPEERNYRNLVAAIV